MLRLNVATVAVLALSGNALAVSKAVKVACKPDYLAYCNSMAVGSPQLRTCMKNNAPRLSKPCLQALVASKEASQADIEDYRAKTKQTD